MTIRIVTDSSCDLPDSILEETGIVVVPLTIRFGDEEFVDRVDLTAKEFWKRCSASDTLPETAAPAPGQFETAYRSLIDEGATGIVVVSLSAKLSATSQSAELAARSVENLVPVRVIDSENVSLGVGSMALAAARVAAEGGTLEAVANAALERVKTTRVVAALDTLENLKKGGRIGNARALLATALSIKPIIAVVDGSVEEAGKQRTRAKALKSIAAKVADDADRIDDLAVLHADCDDVDTFVSMIRQHFSGDIVVGEIGPVIGAHAGLGTIGVAYHLTTTA